MTSSGKNPKKKPSVTIAKAESAAKRKDAAATPKKLRKTATAKDPKTAATIALELLDLNVVPVTNYTDEQIANILKMATLNLLERADLDSLRICATSQKDGKTHYYSTGVGNIYAQMGSVHEWLADVGSMSGGLGGGPSLSDGEDFSEGGESWGA
jgi:hypothetical protein